MGFLYKFQHSN